MKKAIFSQPAGPVSVIRQPQSLPRKRILVVEDDDDIRQLNTEVLVFSGYQVASAADGAAGWEALMADNYDLLLIDHDMPQVTGVELLRKLHGTRMALPVILATGAVPTREFARYPWLQPAATLLKPYTVAELLGTVKDVLRATNSACEVIAPPPQGSGQPLTAGWQLC